MKIEDASNVIHNLQTRPFICSDKVIILDNGYVILKKEDYHDNAIKEKADKLFRHFSGRAKVAFGIGTYISNDTDVKPLNIVMKTTFCNGSDVAKVSDTPGKGMCKNPDYVDYLQRCIDWRMANETV